MRPWRSYVESGNPIGNSHMGSVNRPALPHLKRRTRQPSDHSTGGFVLRQGSCHPRRDVSPQNDDGVDVLIGGTGDNTLGSHDGNDIGHARAEHSRIPAPPLHVAARATCRSQPDPDGIEQIKRDAAADPANQAFANPALGGRVGSLIQFAVCCRASLCTGH